MVKPKLTQELKDFIDGEIRSKTSLDYGQLVKTIARRYGVKISKSLITKRTKALKIEFRRGRKRIFPVEKRPARSVFLDCAGAFFLKGAELDLGLLSAMNQILKTSTESARAKKVLQLAQHINSLLLYAPIFGLNTPEDIVGYQQRGLLYLTEQKNLPEQKEIAQYLRFLTGQKLLLFMIKEVARISPEAQFIRIDFSGQTFYLDAQWRTVWPNANTPRYFSATLNKVKSYVKDIFLHPFPQRPLILQTAPGYTFLPAEMFHFIRCFEQAKDEPISRLVVMGKSGESLTFWQSLKPGRKCYFIFPLTPWQYAKLQGTEIIKDFQRYFIGPEKEAMAVAEARVNLFNPQLHKNIKLRAALVRRKEEHLALLTNISSGEERYIRKIAEAYFSRWPEEKIKTYYDLLEQAHQEVLSRAQSPATLTSLLTMGYNRKPQDLFRLLLEHLNRYVLSHFFPSEYEAETLKSMRERFYQHPGFLKIKQHSWEIILQPIAQKELRKGIQLACQRFNQSGIEFPGQKSLRIYLKSFC